MALGGIRVVSGGAVVRNHVLIIIHNDERVFPFLDLLRAAGYQTELSHSGPEMGVALAKHKPDLALIDSGESRDGLSVVMQLRQDVALSILPIIALIDSSDVLQRLELLAAGADRVLTKPLESADLLATIATTLARTREYRELSPSTGLPGNNRTKFEIDRRISQGDDIAVCYVDIDRFKSVCDSYGFERANRMIVVLSESIQAAVQTYDRTAFVGHIGGDDFIVVCQPPSLRPLLTDMVARFETAADDLYDADDAKRGYILLYDDRSGQPREARLVTLSIGVALTDNHHSPSAETLIRAASDMKTVAKSHRGSYVAIDRRVSVDRQSSIIDQSTLANTETAQDQA